MADDKQIPNKTVVSDSGGLLTITTSYYDSGAVIDPNAWFLDVNTPFEAETGITLLYE